MNFFKSLLLDEEEPLDLLNDEKPTSESPSKPLEEEESEQEEDLDEEQEEEALLNETDLEEEEEEENTGNVWSFGGLIKTFASKSESVIQNYRKDLEDFSSGLKKETLVIREVASRVVKDLPEKFEVGATVAQESLESVGQAIDDIGTTVWKGTAEIISHGKQSLRSVDLDGDSSSDNSQQISNQNVSSRRYSRFEAQLYAIQTDLNTYCEDPEDLDDFSKWKSGFNVVEKTREIESLFVENEVMAGIYSKLVPSGDVDYETFWSRYFYRVYRFKQIEDARANLVKRAISGEEEEDLSWDIDDDEEEGDEKEKENVTDSPKELEKKVTEIGEKSSNEEIDNKGSISGNGSDANETSEGHIDLSALKSKSLEPKANENLFAETGESSKDSDVSIVSSQPSFREEEEDLSWDEIEDMGSVDEKKVTDGGSLNRASLDKRPIVAVEEDEDLSWDIEDDEDEPVKS